MESVNSPEEKKRKPIESTAIKDWPLESFKKTSIYESFGDPASATQKMVCDILSIDAFRFCWRI